MDYARHPLARQAIITVLTVNEGRLAEEGIAKILRPASEPNTYFVQFLESEKISKRLVFPDYQRDPGRTIDAINRHLSALARPSPSTSYGKNGER